MLQQPETPVAASEHAEDKLLLRLKRLGITSWQEPLLCLPKQYQDFSKVSTLKQALPKNDIVADTRLFNLLVSERATIIAHPKKRLFLTATDGMLSVKIVVFIHPGVDVQIWKALKVGDRVCIRGQLQNWNGRLQITGPVHMDATLIGTVHPEYFKRRGVVADGAIYEATRHALQHHLDDTIQFILKSFHGLSEQEILTRCHVRSRCLQSVLLAAHQPASLEEGEEAIKAMRRMAALSIVENARKLKQRDPLPSSIVPITDEIIDHFTSKLPYPLTEDQARTVREIIDDMASPLPMRRVLSGDVGTGKTLPIMIAALATQHLGKRAVILTPNGLLADQFVKECSELFGHEYPVTAVTAGTKRLDTQNNPILVGTTALLSRLKNEPPPALVCVDEEQKLSVTQKTQLMGISTNYLQATATPIPRTTALITHGAMDVSILKENPVKKKITTHIVNAGERVRLFQHVGRVIDAGGQVGIVYPLVKGEDGEKISVISAATEWEKKFPGLVGMIHGQMKDDEKIEAITKLKAGEHKICIASTSIEIGITLSSLRSLIVVHAERYGTSTLHQLRGRVARRGGSGNFFLFLPHAVSDEAMQRLSLLVEHTDGFKLSEMDAEMRGYGDLFEEAERQSGSSRSSIFKCVDLTPEELHQAWNAHAVSGQHPTTTTAYVAP